MHHRIEPHFGDIDANSVADAPSRRPAGPDPNRRKPLVALLIGILCAPVAFLYVGRPALYVVVTVIVLALIPAAGLTGLVQSVGAVWTLLGVLAAYALWTATWPWVIALRATARYRLRWYNRGTMYAAMLTACVLVTVAFAGQMPGWRERFAGFGLYRIPSGSMQPTLDINDKILTDSRAATMQTLARNDLVALHDKEHADKVVAKRVIGLPGEHVTIDAHGVSIDGKRLDEPYTQGSNVLDAPRDYGDISLGGDEYFVLGDNRGNSIDSRRYGPVPRDLIMSKITLIWLANDWSRIGQVH